MDEAGAISRLIRIEGKSLFKIEQWLHPKPLAGPPSWSQSEGLWVATVADPWPTRGVKGTGIRPSQEGVTGSWSGKISGQFKKIKKFERYA